MPTIRERFGVYSITFPSGKVYIGSTAKSFRSREWDHSFLLKKGRHWNSQLQKLHNKYKTFEFKVVEVCSDPSEVLELEQKWINCTPENLRVNHCPVAGSRLGSRNKVPWSKDARAKHSEIFKGHPVSEETAQKISQLAKGRVRSEEAKEKTRQALLGRLLTEETKRRMSEARKRAWELGKYTRKDIQGGGYAHD
jgi:group I intron endonuclease